MPATAPLPPLFSFSCSRSLCTIWALPGHLACIIRRHPCPPSPPSLYCSPKPFRPLFVFFTLSDCSESPLDPRFSSPSTSCLSFVLYRRRPSIVSGRQNKTRPSATHRNVLTTLRPILARGHRKLRCSPPLRPGRTRLSLKSTSSYHGGRSRSSFLIDCGASCGRSYATASPRPRPLPISRHPSLLQTRYERSRITNGPSTMRNGCFWPSSAYFP